MKRQVLTVAVAAALLGSALIGRGVTLTGRPAPPKTVAQQSVAQARMSTHQQTSLAAMAEDPAQWVMPSQNYASTRHSELKEITTENVANLKVAWTMSTGATRGHEGQPLVIGDTMYFESAYPEQRLRGGPEATTTSSGPTRRSRTRSRLSVACCDLVNRGVGYADGKVIVDALDGQVDRAQHQDRQGAVEGEERRSGNGPDPHRLAAGRQGNKVIIGVSGGEFGVRGYLTAFDIDSGKQMWRAYSEGPDSDRGSRPKLQRPEQRRHQHLEGRRVEGRRRHDLGLVLATIPSSTCSTTAPATPARGTRPAPRRQQVVDDMFARDPTPGRRSGRTR